MERIDLHIHSNLSDGDHDVYSLVSKLKEEGITLFSITDHDNVKSVELLESIPNIEYINGVEMSSIFENIKLHILGYGINSTGRISKICNDIRLKRREIILEIIEDLRKKGYRFDEEYLSRFYLDESVVLSKVDISKMLVRMGEVLCVDDAFNRILKPYSLGAKIRRNSEEIISAIKEDGGIAVVAHPSEIRKKSNEDPLKVIAKLNVIGLDGIEVFTTKNNEEETKMFLEYAMRNNMFITGGSDYHGELTKPNINLCDNVVGELISEKVKKKSIKH